MDPIRLENLVFAAVCIFLCGWILYTGVCLYRHTRKTQQPGLYLSLTCCALFLWAFFSIFLFTAKTEAMAIRLTLPKYMGIALVLPLFSLHVRRNVMEKPLPPVVLAMVLFVPVITSLIVLAGDPFHIMFRDVVFPNFPNRFFIVTYGPWFYVHTAYSYVIVIYSYFLLVRAFTLLPKHVRKPITLMIVGLTISVATNVVTVSQGFHIAFDFTIMGTCLTLLFTAMSIRAVSSPHVVLASRDNVIHNLSIAVLVLDRERRIVDTNRTGQEEGELMPNAAYLEPFGHYMARWLEEGDGRLSALNSSVLTFAHGSGERHFNINEKTICAAGQVSGYIVEITEITHLYMLFRHLEESANYDQLTGLFNRNAYMNKIKALEGSTMPLLVMLGDVNMLKLVNDTKGHLAGDALLQRIAAILEDAVPEGAFLARIGGDEFVMLVPRGTMEIGQSVVDRVEEGCQASSNDIFGTPSIAVGYAVMDSKDVAYDDVIAEADRMMYEDKRKSRGGLRYRGGVHPPSDE